MNLDACQPEIVALLEHLLQSGKACRVRATGRSMWPLLRGGETLLIERPGSPRLGDLLLCRGQGRGLLIHRLIGMQPQGATPARYVTQGDAVPWPDQPFAEWQLLGRVRAIERLGAPRALGRIDLDRAAWRAVGALVAACQAARDRPRRGLARPART
jgi:hypothetical protein